jgi:hypothetical protein
MFHVSPQESRDQDPIDRAAQDAADAIRADAEREAARIIREAEERADLLIKERLAYAERELDKLRSLRRNVGTLLESSVSALRVVEHLLPNDRARLPRAESRGRADSSDSPAYRHWLARALATPWTPYRYATVLAGALAIAGAVAIGAWYAALPADATPRAADVPQAQARTVDPPDAAVAPPAPSVSPAATSGNAPTPAGVSTASAESPALTVTLSAHGQCWIRATIDGTEIMERLMQPDQEIVLNAREGILLRIGDAGALTATINGKPAARFGQPGEVITRHITLQNYGV